MRADATCAEHCGVSHARKDPLSAVRRRPIFYYSDEPARLRKQSAENCGFGNHQSGSPVPIAAEDSRLREITSPDGDVSDGAMCFKRPGQPKSLELIATYLVEFNESI